MKRTIALMLFLAQAAWAQQSSETMALRAAAPPVLDGKLDEVCWLQASACAAFTRPSSQEPAARPISLKVCFDDAFLYFGALCAGETDVLEIFLRTSHSPVEYDQFTLAASNERGAVRRRAGGQHAGKWEPAWETAVDRRPDGWQAEIKIPFAAIELTDPGQGKLVELKVGRRAPAGPALATWPAGSAYGGAEEYGALYLGDPNLLLNPDLSQRDEDRPKAWGIKKEDSGLFLPADDAGRPVMRVITPGRYCAMGQSLPLEPNRAYRLECEAKGDAGLYIRARTVLKPGGPSVAHTADFRPSPDYQRIAAQFATGPDGKALIIIGSTEGSGKGTVLLRGLRVVREISYDATGPAFPVAPNADRPVVVTKLLVADSRAVRGFLGTPFDGTLESYDWDARTWEYPQRGGGAGVGYAYMNNDGLHVRLGDARGFDAILVRGGVHAKVYAGQTNVDGPGAAPLIFRFPGKARVSRAMFSPRVLNDRVSFFEVKNGLMANVSFFRIGAEAPAGNAVPMKAQGAAPLRLSPDAPESLTTLPLDKDTPLAAVGLEFDLGDAPAGVHLTAAVKDLITPRLELMGADFAVTGPGRVRLVLDFPDQVIPAGKALSLVLASKQSAVLSALQVYAYQTTRPDALPEALAYRKFLMKSLFCCASEARPWMGMTRKTDLEKWYAANHWGAQVREVMETVEHCRWLDPADDTVRQYHEWLWQRRLDLPPFTPKIDSVPGAPEWAVVARQAWLTARQVPKWWLENRLVPTGEFGGLVGDDSDMYQNYVDFAMFERDGVAAELKVAAANLAELAEQTTLEEGLNKRTTDPLHAYEEGLNQEALMAVWNYGDPVYLERCMVAARSTEALTTITPRGHRHFKSQKCGAEDLRINRPTDEDAHAHPLMWHPTFEVLWYNRNPKAEKMLREWADGWLEHIQANKYASGVEVASEKVTTVEPRPLRGGYGSQGSAFCFLAWITGDTKYVGPFMEAFAAGRTDTSPGNLLPEFLHRYDFSAIRDALPALVKGRGVAETLVTGDKASLIEALKRDIAELQRFPAMYTTSEPFTDRVFLYPITNAAIAYTGGYASRNKFNRSHAVSWSGFGTDYAALVLRANPQRFKALLYNFKDAPVTGEARWWTLDHGRYRLRLAPDLNADDEPDAPGEQRELVIVRGVPVSLTLPPKTVMVLDATLVEALDDVRFRADLALSPRGVRAEGGRVVGVAHNIGAKAAEGSVVLVAPDGQVRVRKALGVIEAPLDLTPRRVEFSLEGVPARAAGWAVVLDAEDKVPEICEQNNRVGLK